MMSFILLVKTKKGAAGYSLYCENFYDALFKIE